MGSRLPLTSISPRSSHSKRSPQRTITAAVACTVSVAAVDSMREARLTASPVTVMWPDGSGAIVTTGSVAAFDNIPNVGYKAAKAGLDAFTKQLAIQNAEFGIRANSVVPGSIDTPMGLDIRVRMSGANRDELKAKRAAIVPLRRMGSGWDIANAALFLVSDEASFITGVSLVVDGGWLVSLSAVGQ